MTEHSTNPIEQMAHLAGELTEAAMTGQAAGLQVLMAEMQALAQIIPVVSGITPLHPNLAEHSPTQAEIEADFDNMPI